MAQKFLDLETGLPELWKKTTEKIEIATSTKLDSEDYLGPVVMEGNPLRFDNGVEGLNIAVTEQVLEPVQAGSGDPSPENIRAISGWTGVKLNTAGAQLLDDTNLSGIVLGTMYRCDNPFKVAGTYTISIHITGGTEQGVTFAIRSASGNIAQYSVRSGTPVVMEVTEDILQNLDHCMIYVFSGSTGATLDWIMVNAGDTALPYEPYQGNTYTAEFGDAVYGGMMNWTTGEMTVDRGFYAFTGNERVSAVNLTNSDSVKQILFYNMDAQNAMASGDEICSHYLFNSLATSGMFVGFKIVNTAQWTFGISVDTLLQYGSADNNTREEWAALAKAFLADQYAAGTPVQVAYKLAEPYTIQMTPQEIKQLNGTNTLYGDGTSLRAIFNASASSPVDTNLSTTSSNPVQNKTVTSSINSLKSVATASSAGLMSATDKSKLDTITTSADSVSFSQSATSGNKVGTITINGTAIDMYSPIQTTISGNAATATKVSNVLTIQANGSSLGTFDGSSAKTFNITYSNIGAAASSHGTHVSYGTSASALGTSSAGSASTVSRSDHVHALPALTSCTGTLTIAKGGTGATSAANARSNLGIKSGTTLPTSGSVGDIFFLY